ncbi:hypothetical protein FACS189483_00950 [Spirochaetia bacterium]|nr:hypothetical protein FACS189483_00950 [Spirochaetia bacterium]
MPKFYEIKVFTVIGYIALLLFSFIGYFAGRIFLLGIAFIPIPFIMELIISIMYIKFSYENKKFHFLSLSIIIFILSVFIGIGTDIHETENTKKYLINAGNIIEEYKLDNNIDIINYNDLNNIGLSKDIKIELYDTIYILKYRDGIYHSETKMVSFRPRP